MSCRNLSTLQSILASHHVYDFSTPFPPCKHHLLSKSVVTLVRRTFPVSSHHSNLSTHKLLDPKVCVSLCWRSHPTRMIDRLTLFECLFGLAYSHLITQDILPLWWLLLTAVQLLTDIIFVFDIHFSGSHVYASVICVIIRMHKILQNVDITLTVFVCGVFPHFGFKRTINSC